MDDAKRGHAAIDAKQYQEAVQHFTNAIAKQPNAPSYYTSRSLAHARLSPPNKEEAVRDAEIAVVLAENRPREMFMEAQERRYIALHNIGRFEDARFICDYATKRNDELKEKEAIKKAKNEANDVAKYDKKSMPLIMWGTRIDKSLKKANEELQNLKSSPADHFDEAIKAATEALKALKESSTEWKGDEAALKAIAEVEELKKTTADWNVTVLGEIVDSLNAVEEGLSELNNDAAKAVNESLKKLVDPVSKVKAAIIKITRTVEVIPDKKILDTRNPQKAASEPTPALVKATSKSSEPATAPSKISPELNKSIKRDWIQSAEHVTITILAKAVPKDSISVEFEEHSVSVSFPIPGRAGSTHDDTLDPLFGPIDPAQSKCNVTPNKVEIILKKNTNIKWSKLEGTVEASKDPENPEATKTPAPTPYTSKPSAPMYPTSSKSGPKNWDKVADDLTRKPKTDEDKGTGKDEYDDLDEEGDSANSFFKTLFKGADPDTQRAMMKSYQESNGTALSTNWAEVSKGKVETTPPDGMVAKKWGE